MPKRGTSRKRNPAAAQRQARKAAAERHMARYIPLLCGHFGDYDTDVFYSPIQRGLHYCVKCAEWIAERKPDAAAYTSQSPQY